MSRWRSDDFVAAISLSGSLHRAIRMDAVVPENSWLVHTPFLAAALLTDRDLLHGRAATFVGRTWCLIDGHFLDSGQRISLERLWEGSAPPTAGSFNLILWKEDDREARVRSDGLGFRTLYYWVSRHQDTLVLTSSIRLMRRLVPQLQPDPAAFTEQLLLSATMAGRTLLRQVQRLEPSTELRLSRNGFSKVHLQRTSWFGNAHAGLSTRDTAALITAQAREVTRDWLKGRPVSVALSGGYDSRFLLLLALELEADVQAVTLGDDDWVDARLAKRVAAFYGLRHRCVVQPAVIDLDAYIRGVQYVEHVSDYMSGFWACQMAAAVTTQECSILNGFLGGPVSGAALQWTQSRACDEVSIIRGWVRHVNEANVPCETLRRFWRQPIPDLDKLHLELVPLLFRGLTSFQAVTWLELVVRQTGFVSPGTYGFYRRFSEPLIPLADFRLVRLFSNCSESQLRGQVAYRTAVASLDKSGTPFASTSGKRPATFKSGPQQVVQRGFRMLAPPLCDLLRTYRKELRQIMEADLLAQSVRNAGRTEGHISITQCLMLSNAAILWLVYSGVLKESASLQNLAQDS